MRVLVCASAAPPLFEAQQLAAACAELDLDVVIFDHRASRDPTLELPAAVRAARPAAVLIAGPEREEPATLDLARRFGARVCLWIPPAAGDPLVARRRWLARAADGVAVTSAAQAALFVDRHGRPAVVVPGGFHARTLGIDPAHEHPPHEAVNGMVAVRGAGDPLAIAPIRAELRLTGIGPAAEFPRGTIVRTVRAPEDFRAALDAHRFLDGGRGTDVAPCVFDAAVAAAAAGIEVLKVPLMGVAGAAVRVDVDASAIEAACFTRRLAALPAFLG